MNLSMPDSSLLLTKVGSAIAIAKSGKRSVVLDARETPCSSGVVDRVTDPAPVCLSRAALAHTSAYLYITSYNYFIS